MSTAKNFMKQVLCPLNSNLPTWANSCTGTARVGQLRCTKCGLTGHAEARVK